jgi:copper transport protein
VVIRRLCLLGLLALLLPAAPASAHALLEETAPARAAALEAAPAQVELRFSEPVEVTFGAVRVYGADGAEVQDGAAFHPRDDDRAVAVPLRGGLPDGGYTVTYRVVSADSHPVSGGFVFGIGEGGAASAATVGELLDGQSAGPATSVAFAAVRALQFAAIALAVGALAILALVWLPALAALATPAPVAGGAPESHAALEGDGPSAAAASGGEALPWAAASAAFAARWRQALALAAGMGLASALLALPLQAATAAGTTFWAAIGDAGDVLQTRFGTVWGIGALAWLLVLGLAVARRASVPAARPATVGAAGIAVPRAGRWLAALALPIAWLVALPALGGHAGVQEPVAVLLPANVLHVIAASAWIGGIAVLVVALPAATRRLQPPDRTRLLAGTVGRFSTLALVAVAALLIGGILQSLLELSAVDDLVDTAYGRAITVKSALVAVLLGLGAWNRRRTLPSLAREAHRGASPGRPGAALRRALHAEVALGVAALAATGALAGYSPGAAQATGPFSDSTDYGPARAELTVEPALAGPNEVHIYLFDRADGTQWDETEELTVRASLPAKGVAPIELDARKAGPGHYVIGGAPLAPAGDWRLEFVSRLSEFEEQRATFEVPVR